MDLLQQLDAKMQALLQQRNQLKEELDALKSAGAAGDQELQSLRARLEEAVAARTALCLLYTSPSPRDRTRSRMPSSA